MEGMEAVRQSCRASTGNQLLEAAEASVRVADRATFRTVSPEAAEEAADNILVQQIRKSKRWWCWEDSTVEDRRRMRDQLTYALRNRPMSRMVAGQFQTEYGSVDIREKAKEKQRVADMIRGMVEARVRRPGRIAINMSVEDKFGRLSLADMFTAQRLELRDYAKEKVDSERVQRLVFRGASIVDRALRDGVKAKGAFHECLSPVVASGNKELALLMCDSVTQFLEASDDELWARMRRALRGKVKKGKGGVLEAVEGGRTPCERFLQLNAV